MKKNTIFLIFLLLFTYSSISKDKRYKNIFTDKESIGGKKIKKLASKELKFSFPVEGREYLKFKVKNLTIYFYPEKIFPTVRLHGYIKAGEIYDTKKQVSKLTALLLRESDTQKMKNREINDVLDFDGSQLEFIPGRDWVEIDGKYLVENEENFLKSLSYLVARPIFSEDKLKVVKKRLKGEAKRSDDVPFLLCRKLFYKIIYGNHPYGYFYTAEGIDDVGIEDVKNFYNKFYTPGRIVLAFSGDIKTGRIISALKKYLGESFLTREEHRATIPEVKMEFKPGVYICEKKHVTQAAIYFGRLIKIEKERDLYGISLFNHILGGSSFASKYTQQIRDIEGIAYRVDSKFETDNLTGALFLSRCRTKLESTYRAIADMLWIQDGFVNRRITAHEFEMGRSGLGNGFIKNFNTVDNILNLIVKNEILGRNISILKNFRKEVYNLSYEDLVEAAKRVVSPENYTYVLVGDLKEYEGRLKKFGKIYRVDEKGNMIKK